MSSSMTNIRSPHGFAFNLPLTPAVVSDDLLLGKGLNDLVIEQAERLGIWRITG